MNRKSRMTIEDKIAHVEKGSVRYHVLEVTKRFKTSWVEMGRALYSVWKDKMYKEWGYQTFEGYVTKEIGIRKQTSMKLLRSYYFLENEEPQYLQGHFLENQEASHVPSFEAIDVLRRAKGNKNIDPHEYVHLKKNVFYKGAAAGDIRRDLTTLIRQREELTPEEVWVQKKERHVKSLLSTLKALKREMDDLKILPRELIQEITRLINKIDLELG